MNKTTWTLFSFIVTGLLLVTTCSCVKNHALLLPGQNIPASLEFVEILNDVQKETGLPITIADLSDHSNPNIRSGRGLAQITSREVIIWLNPSLGYDVQEAVAAHEIAHIHQAFEGYYMVEVFAIQGQPFSQQFAKLASKINGAILDTNADEWAAKKGFKIEEGLRTDYLVKAFESIEFLKEGGYVETNDWSAYFEDLSILAEALKNGTTSFFAVTKEFATQHNAVQYLNWKLRLEPYDLFQELDDAFRTEFPVTWSLGNELGEIVEPIGVSEKTNCNEAINKLVEYMKIPDPLFQIIDMTKGTIDLD